MPEPTDDVTEIDLEVARQAAIETYGLKVVETAETAFDNTCVAQVLGDRAIA